MTDASPSPVRAALIVASNWYEDATFGRLRAPVRDAEALAGVLSDPAVGDFRVQALVNEPWHRVREEVEGFFAEHRRNDLLLLYFSCHGVKDPNGQLYFATTDTKFSRLAATGISSSFLNQQIDRSRSKRIVLLLDCCYSGAFTRGLVARAGEAVDVTERFEGGGRAVITASSAMEYAFEGDELSDVRDVGSSVFTSALVRGLETGDADRDGDGRVSVDELYDYLYEEVRQATPNQTPSMLATVQGSLYLARNPHPARAADLPSELRQAMESELPWQREGAVSGLVALLGGGATAGARAARMALERMVGDDNSQVGDAARRALAAVPAATMAADPVRWRPPQGGEGGGPVLLQLRLNDLPVHGVALSPDGRRLATASDDKTARVWDAASGAEIARLRHAGLLNWVLAVAYAPHGRWLATGTLLQAAWIWDLASSRMVVRLRCGESVRAVAFSPDGAWLATASDDTTARVWDIANGRELTRVAHAQAVTAVGFSPDGAWLATASHDTTARVWDIASGRELARATHDAQVGGMALSSDGRVLTTGCSDSVVRMWSIEVLRAQATQPVRA